MSTSCDDATRLAAEKENANPSPATVKTSKRTPMKLGSAKKSAKKSASRTTPLRTLQENTPQKGLEALSPAHSQVDDGDFLTMLGAGNTSTCASPEGAIAEVATLKDQIVHLQAQNNTMESQIEELEEELDTAKQTIRTLETEKVDSKALEKQVKDLQVLNIQLEAQIKEFKAVEGDVEEARIQKLERAVKELEQANECIEALEAAHTNVTKELEESKEELARFKKGVSIPENMAALEQKIRDLQTQRLEDFRLFEQRKDEIREEYTQKNRRDVRVLTPERRQRNLPAACI
mmetsp:Transcript_12982/g.25122  ORF Transcript_12982/g.25122 Transcript_12982/m.25122 type:complete len:291 (-) Transcript_12982:3798-4670(-)